MTSKTATFYGLLCFECGVNPEIKPKQQPDIHLNLWENNDDVNLDIGLMLDVDHPSKSVDIFFPWPNKSNSLIDLLDRISINTAISAIFNESLLTTSSSGNSGLIVSNPTSKEELFAVIKAQDSITKRTHDSESHALSIDIEKLSKNAKNLSSEIKRMYIRFRVTNVPKSFYSVGIDQADKGFSSSWQSTEIIDFRLNVRRGIPVGLESNTGRFLDFGKVHLFLMRSQEHDLVFQDTLFRSCRSLEDEDFWAEYSINSTTKNENEKSIAKNRIKTSLGYQWTKKQIDDNKLIKEFSILARFKKTNLTIIKFIAFAIIFGALGSGSWDGVKYIYGKITSSEQVNNKID